MKIIKNNNIKQSEKIIELECICPNCNSVLEIDENDIQYDREDDEKYVTCPCCHMRITDEYFDRIVTLDNISYPFDFYKIGKNENIKRLSNDIINEMIQECITFFKQNPQESYKFLGTGDTLVIMFNLIDEYYIVIAKDYEESFIDKA